MAFEDRRGRLDGRRTDGGGHVDFDIFSEQQMVRPWPAEHEKVVFADTIEQAKLADEAGFRCWWTVEHHAATEFSYSSAPELTLTAIALNTRDIHVGHAGVLIPYQINHPIRVAERAAVLERWAAHARI